METYGIGGMDRAPDTRRRRRLRELLLACGERRPSFVTEAEWAAARRWAMDRQPLDRVARELGLTRWPLKRALERLLGRLERAQRDGPLSGRDQLAVLPRRQAFLLRRAGLASLRHVAAATDAELLAIGGIGPAGLARLRALAPRSKGTLYLRGDAA